MSKNLSCTDCGHVFHKKCILSSLVRKKECPTCRKKATADSLRDLFYTIETKLIDVTDRELLGVDLDKLPQKLLEDAKKGKEGKQSC
jgi:hypothetical protein